MECWSNGRTKGRKENGVDGGDWGAVLKLMTGRP